MLSDTSYSIKSFENVGFKIKFTGYSDKIVKFTEIFLEGMIKISNLEGFDPTTVRLAVEKSLKSY